MSQRNPAPRAQSPGRRRFVSDDRIPRTIWFPPGVLARIESGKPPGALIELLTELLSDHLKGDSR